MGWLDAVLFWHWWILAGVLLIFELTTPIFVFLWLGFAAAAVGFLLLVFPNLGIEAQLVLFGVLSELLVRIYHETRGQPTYRIRHIFRGGVERRADGRGV